MRELILHLGPLHGRELLLLLLADSGCSAPSSFSGDSAFPGVSSKTGSASSRRGIAIIAAAPANFSACSGTGSCAGSSLLGSPSRGSQTGGEVSLICSAAAD